MYTAKDIWDSLFETLNATHDDELKKKIKRECRKAYYELCRATSWEHLREEVQYRFNPDDDGMWLPADLAGIDCVANKEHVWKKSQKSYAENANIQARMWFIDERSHAPLVLGNNISIKNGEADFTGAENITDEMAGEYIRIGGQDGVYKLESRNKLSTPYYGDDLASGEYEVRPGTVQKIKLIAPYGEIDTTPAKIYYWRLPSQLYDESQLVLLPTSTILELLTSIKIYNILRMVDMKNSAQKDLYGSKGRYDGELSRAIALNPDFVPPIQPDNHLARPAGWGARGWR